MKAGKGLRGSSTALDQRARRVAQEGSIPLVEEDRPRWKKMREEPTEEGNVEHHACKQEGHEMHRQ